MTENKWHLLSTFETEDSLDMFCRKAGFIRDKDEKYLYVLKDGVERGVEMKRDDWFRISISDGYAYEFRDGEWSDSSTTLSTTTMPIRASIWIFGAEDEYTESRQKFEKAVQTFKDYFYVLNRYEDMDRDLRELFVGDDEDGVLERLRKVKKQLEEQTEDKIDISDDIDELVTELNRILLNDYTDGRDSDKQK